MRSADNLFDKHRRPPSGAAGAPTAAETPVPPDVCRPCARAGPRRPAPLSAAADQSAADVSRRRARGRGPPRPATQVPPSDRATDAAAAPARGGWPDPQTPQRWCAVAARRGNRPPEGFLVRLTAAFAGPSRTCAPPQPDPPPPAPERAPESTEQPAHLSLCQPPPAKSPIPIPSAKSQQPSDPPAIATPESDFQRSGKPQSRQTQRQLV